MCSNIADNVVKALSTLSLLDQGAGQESVVANGHPYFHSERGSALLVLVFTDVDEKEKVWIGRKCGL